MFCDPKKVSFYWENQKLSQSRSISKVAQEYELRPSAKLQSKIQFYYKNYNEQVAFKHMDFEERTS